MNDCGNHFEKIGKKCWPKNLKKSKNAARSQIGAREQETSIKSDFF